MSVQGARGGRRAETPIRHRGEVGEAKRHSRFLFARCIAWWPTVSEAGVHRFKSCHPDLVRSSSTASYDSSRLCHGAGRSCLHPPVLTDVARWDGVLSDTRCKIGVRRPTFLQPQDQMRSARREIRLDDESSDDEFPPVPVMGPVRPKVTQGGKCRPLRQKSNKGGRPRENVEQRGQAPS
jgi:hypothetical protein